MRVNRVGDHLLAHAALAHNENVGIRRAHRVDQFLDFLHRLALKNRYRARFCDFQTLFELLCFLPQFLRFPKQELFLQRFFHKAEQLLWRVWFADKMERAAFDRLDGIMQRVVGR